MGSHSLIADSRKHAWKWLVQQRPF